MCFGAEASERTKSLLPEGAPIHLARDRELTDKFGRVLAYVYRDHDGLFVNLDLIEGGYAAPLIIEPNHAHASEILAASERAKSQRLGAWGACPQPFDQ
jgi:micrococcal nuclease